MSAEEAPDWAATAITVDGGPLAHKQEPGVRRQL